MKIVKKPNCNLYGYRLLPLCVCTRGNSRHLFDGRNYLWLNWLICFNDDINVILENV